MSNKDNKKTENSQMNVGDISTIKDILFGADIQSIERRFNEFEARTNENNQLQSKDLVALRKDIDEQMADMTKRFDETIVELKSKVDVHVEELKQQIENVSKSDKASLANVLQELSTSLIKNG